MVVSWYFSDPRVFVLIDFSVYRRTAVGRNADRNKPTLRSNTANVTPHEAISWGLMDQMENYLQRRQNREDDGNNSVLQACEACLPVQPSNKNGLKIAFLKQTQLKRTHRQNSIFQRCTIAASNSRHIQIGRRKKNTQQADLFICYHNCIVRRPDNVQSNRIRHQLADESKHVHRRSLHFVHAHLNFWVHSCNFKRDVRLETQLAVQVLVVLQVVN